jgi:DNA-binding Lrp family transcriptional regulator
MHDPDDTPPLPTRLDALDAALINRLQIELPLLPRPFAALAEELACGETQLIARLQRLLAQGTLSRFGPIFQIERAGGRFVLAAMAVPEARYAEVAALVNAMPEVAHNCRREHALNMWFLLATENPADISGLRSRIETATGLAVLAFPREREYHAGLYLEARAEEVSHV